MDCASIFYGRPRKILLVLVVALTVAFILMASGFMGSDIIRPSQQNLRDYGLSNWVRNYAQGRPSERDVHAHNHEAWDRVLDAQGAVKMLNFDDKHAHHDDDSVAKGLAEKVRVLIWVMTAPKNLQTKARVVRDTWGRRANKLIFFSSETNKTFPTVGLNVSEGREHLTAKTMKGFRYVYDNHFNDADWFMKADDDTYVVVENLRYFLSGENSSAPVFFGHHFKTIVKQGYYSGGGGYVLSKEALRRFAEKGNDPSICRPDGGAEDAEFGKCMEKLGVHTVNTTDALGRSRFHCFDPETHLFGGYPGWYYQYDANGAKKGEDSISDYAITFHYVSPQKMQALEYFIYHLTPYGIMHGSQSLNKIRDKRSSGTR